MDRQEAIMRLFKWDRQESVYKDYRSVCAGEMDMETFSKRWKEGDEGVDFALHHDDCGMLRETDWFQNQFDIGIVKSPRYSPTFWHEHEFYEIVYVLNGACVIDVGEARLRPVTGDFLMLAPGHRHQIDVCSDESVVINILIRTSTLLDIFMNAIRDKSLISRFLLSQKYGDTGMEYLFFHTQSDHVIRDYVLDIYIELQEADEYSNKIAVCQMTILFSQLIRRHAASAEIPSGTQRGAEYTSAIMNYVIENYTDCTLEDISQHLHFSTQYTSKLIKNTIGLSFRDLITDIKLQKAKLLLEETPMKIDDISEYLGYKNSETLIRVFQRVTGMTPSAYRKGAARC